MSETRQPYITPDMVPQSIPDALSYLPRMLRQPLAGVLTIPSEAINAGVAIANPNRIIRRFQGQSTSDDAQGILPGLEATSRNYNNIVNRALGVEDPSPQDDTGEFLARLAGNSLPAAPLRLPAAIAQGVAQLPRAGRIAANLPLQAAELLTPLSITGSRTVGGRAASVAANVGVQGVAGNVIERLTEPMDPTKPYDVLDADGNFLGQMLPADEPGLGRRVGNAVSTAVSEHPVAAGLGGLTAAGLAGLGLRGAMRSASQRAAQVPSDIIRPLDRASEEVPLIESTPRNALNRVAEVTQDADIRTKDAIQQADPTGFEVTRNAMDRNNPQAHADRLIAGLEQGVIDTPHGTITMEPLRRWRESLHHQTQRDASLTKNTNELIAIENEIANRAYAAKKGETVQIDRTTGDLVRPNTNPADIEVITPRATLWNRADADLIARRDAIRQTDRNAAAYADRYYNIQGKIADAAVNFGLLSKAERAMWGKANPNFMHTINMDMAKSPRTWRIRGHREGPEYAGDPTYASVEYADFMLSHMYENAKKQAIIESLREGAKTNPGVFSNGQWLGRIAHPAELRRTLVPDAPGSTNKRPMTMNDVPIKGDHITYYDKGELVHVEVRNKQLLETLKRSPATAATMMGWARQMAQSGMTGKLSMLMLQPFTLANAIMGGMAAMVNRPAGMKFGYLDAGMQNLTGGKVGFRADPTAIAGMAYSGIADTGAILVRAVSEALYNSVDASGFLTKTFGAGKVKAAADYAAQRYMESMYAARSRIGANNASTLGERDFGNTGNRASVIDTIAPHGANDRIIAKPDDAKEYVQMIAQRATPADAKIFMRIVTDINEAVGGVAQGLLFRQNYGKVKAKGDIAVPIEQQLKAHADNVRPYFDQAKVYREAARAEKKAGNNVQARALYKQARDEIAKAKPDLDEIRRLTPQMEAARTEWFNEYSKLGVATRQLLGDPAQMGTGLRDLGRPGRTSTEKLVGWLLNATPYGNIGMQAGARLIRASKENPLGTAAAVGMGIMPMAMLPIANAIMLDRKRVENGEEPIYVKFDLGREAWNVTRFIPIYVPGLSPDEAPRLRVDPLLSLPFTLFREMAVKLFNLGGNPSVEPLIGQTADALVHMAGERARGNIWTSIKNASPISQAPPPIDAAAGALGVDLPDLGTVTRGATLTPRGGLGGFEETRLAGAVTPRWFDNVMGAIAGGAGLTFTSALNQGAIQEKQRSGTFAGAFMDEVLGKARARLPEVQPLWNQPVQRGTNDPAADANNAKEAVMKRIQENTPSVNNDDTVGRGRFMEQVRPGEGRSTIQDPQMRELLNRVSAFSRQVDVLRQARAKDRERLIAVDQRQDDNDYVSRLRSRNEITDNIRRINAELLSRYTDFEDRMTREYGRRIRIEQIQPTKPFSQFESVR